MSSAPFPANAVLKACVEASDHYRSLAQPGSDHHARLEKVRKLQTLTEKVIEQANSDFHATISVDADEMDLIASHLKFEGAPPIAAEITNTPIVT